MKKLMTLAGVGLLLSAALLGPGGLLLGQYSMGILPQYDAGYDRAARKAVLTRSAYTSLPARASVRGYAPQPGSQGAFGTCTAWATAYAARTIKEAVDRGWTDRGEITRRAYAAGYQFKVIAPEKTSCNGSVPSDCVESLRRHGSVPISALAVQSGEGYLCPGAEIVGQYAGVASGHRIAGHATLFEQGSDDAVLKITRVKKSLSERNPVVIAMIWPPSFFGVGSDGRWRPTESPNGQYEYQHGRHAMCVVGYDDAEDGGAFEVQNSWGQSWGQGGYVWIRYSDFAAFVYQAYELQSSPAPRPTPGPTPGPVSRLFEGRLRLANLDSGGDFGVRLSAPERNWNVMPTDPSHAQTYEVEAPLRAGSRLRLYVSNAEAAYVYVLGTGSNDRSVSTLFPGPGVSASLNYRQNEVALPSEDTHLELDATPGTDYLLLLYSKSPLDIEQLRAGMSVASGSPGQRLHAVLGQRLLPQGSINFNARQVQFTAQGNSDQVLALIVSSTRAGY